ncbi:type II secretion system (T2SS) protein F [Azospirillum brasilense]|nr:type II secretion system (T2SS) protein F [Azospirillum brasilense]
MYCLPRLHGQARDVVDQWPIFQTYRVWQGSIWLRALAALVAAGLTIPKAMDSLAGNGTPYMNWIVDEIRENLTESLPEALRKMDKEWPSPAMITALGILLDEGKPEKALQRYADDWLEDGRERIKESMVKLKMIGYIFALVVGVWFYNGVNQMFLAFTNL